MGQAGQPHGAEALRLAGKGGVALRAVVPANADQQGENLRAVVEDILAQVAITLRAIAAALDDRGMLTRRGGQ